MLLAVLAAASCAAPGRLAPEPASPPAEQSATPIATDALIAAILAEANRAREADGAEPLVLEDHLGVAAGEYAVELAGRRRLSHESPVVGRHSLTDRLAHANARGWIRVGENLAKVPVPAAELPTRVVSLWLHSSGHRRNLLDPAFRTSGIGISRDADGYWYVTQVYAAPDEPLPAR